MNSISMEEATVLSFQAGSEAQQMKVKWSPRDSAGSGIACAEGK